LTRKQGSEYIRIADRQQAEGGFFPCAFKEEKVDHWRGRIKKNLRDFFFGATAFEIQQTVRQEKLARLDLILLSSFGDILGVPVFPPYHSLRLLPYFYPALGSWKKRMLKKRDLTEISAF